MKKFPKTVDQLIREWDKPAAKKAARPGREKRRSARKPKHAAVLHILVNGRCMAETAFDLPIEQVIHLIGCSARMHGVESKRRKPNGKEGCNG